jgi:glycosyltransferase involved in cell wall biosynthesis
LDLDRHAIVQSGEVHPPHDDAVLDQAGPFELEYRIVDGGSTDDTRAILESYGNQPRWVSEPDKGQVDA